MLNPPHNDKFPDEDPFGQGRWARRLIIFTMALLFGLAMALRCQPDPHDACAIVCGLQGDKSNGYDPAPFLIKCYCGSEEKSSGDLGLP